MSIEWQEPPSVNRGRPSSFKLYEELRANPGKWALWKEEAYSNSGYQLRKTYPDIQVTVRRDGSNPNGVPLYSIYVRWVGDNGEFATDDKDPF